MTTDTCNYYHQLEMKLRKISTNPDTRKYFDSDRLEFDFAATMIDSWNYLDTKYRNSLKKWLATFVDLNKSEEKASKDQIDAFIKDVDTACRKYEAETNK